MKKRNFLGGMQNYNEHTGEYEPALVGKNGKVVTDADGDGKAHEGSKQPYSKELEKHNKIIDSINNNYSKMSKEEYWKKMDEEVDRFNAIQEKYSREEINGEADFNDPKERESLKEEEKDFEEISEGLADYQWMITDKTTVGQYAEEVGNKLGKSKEEVLSVIRNENEDIKETDKMSVVAGLEEEQDFNTPSEAKQGVEQDFNEPKYQTINDLSSSVKKELKEKGFNTKGISVRGRNVGYSDALDITIKDPNIDIDEVRKLVNKHESYERDASGDILQGGNRYVNVKYEYGLFDSIGEENKEEASKLIEQAKSNNGSGIELGNKHYLFHDKRDGQTFIHSNEHGMTPIYSPERLGSYLYQIKKFGRIVGR